MRSMLPHTDNATRPNLIFRLFICAPPIELNEFESANPRRLLVKQRCDTRVRGPSQATVKVDRTLTHLRNSYQFCLLLGKAVFQGTVDNYENGRQHTFQHTSSIEAIH